MKNYNFEVTNENISVIAAELLNKVIDERIDRHFVVKEKISALIVVRFIQTSF